MADYENANDELEALMNGSLVLETEDETETSVEDEKIEEAQIDEDTDQSESEVNDDADTTGGNDGDYLETEEVNEDEDEENTLVDEDNEDETKDDADGEVETSTAKDEANEDSTDTKDTEEEVSADKQNDEDPETETIDYKKQYEDLLAKSDESGKFYEQVTAGFKANGVDVDGFKDPDKIRKAMQMGMNYSEKMAGFKPYRPFMDAMKKEGLLDSPEKFDFAMDLLKGDKGAITQLLKQNEIEPVDLDIEEDNGYAPKQYRSSGSELALDDLIGAAKARGVDDTFTQEMSGRWLEDGSLNKLVENSEDSTAIINHMSNEIDGKTVYQHVMSRVASKKLLDDTGMYSGRPTIEQYKIAALELEKETEETSKASAIDTLKVERAAIEARKADILAAREAKDYEAKVTREKAKAESKRNKATMLSKPKKKAKVKPKFDPVETSQKLEGDDLMDYFNKHIMNRNY